MKQHAEIEGQDFSSEIQIKSSRSSGKGGQHVNKVETAVELRWHLAASKLLKDEELKLLKDHLKTRLTRDGWLIMTCQTARTQGENRALVMERFKDLITKGLIPPKKRKRTRMPSWVKEQRKQEKKRQSQKKHWRRGDSYSRD